MHDESHGFMVRLWRGGLYWGAFLLGLAVLAGVVSSLRTTAQALESRRQLQLALAEIASGSPSDAGERAGAVVEDWPTSRHAWQVSACGYWAAGEFDLAMARWATLNASGVGTADLTDCHPEVSPPSMVEIPFGAGWSGGVVVPELKPEFAHQLPSDDDLRATAAGGAHARLLLQTACRYQHQGWPIATVVLLRATRVLAGSSANADIEWLLDTWPACAGEPT